VIDLTQEEIKMYEELLTLLETRFTNGEIDKENYEELKERYAAKLEKAKENYETHKEASQIFTSGVKAMSDDSLSVAGSTKIRGGQVAKDIRIAGSGKIESDVECNNLRSAGSLKSSGNIIAHGDVGCAGSFKCEGFLHVDKDAKFSGSAKIEGETIVQGRLTSAGSFHVEGNVQAESGAKFSGAVSVEGSLLSKGVIEVQGKVNVNENIIGEDILINKGRAFIELRFKRWKPSRIDGSVFGVGQIYLANVAVYGDVKGLKVEIGPYAKVDGTVFYVEDMYVDRNAELVNEPIKISREQLVF
jgi:cytoskeletal protein CcmA (bactofilin family)